jgi:hypothetical protein
MVTLAPVQPSSSSTSAARLISQIRAEYDEMPCLRLTLPQAARFWSVDRDTCRAVLERLVVEGYLIEGRSGYMRA